MSVRFLSGINVDSNTLFVDDSNNRVGIGTASPSYQLHLLNALNSVAAINIDGSDQANVRLRLTNGGTGGRTYELIGGLAGANNSNFSIFDATASATRLTIDSSGNVGIGTTAPNQNLHVVGNLRLESTYPRIFFTDTDSNSDYSIINDNGSLTVYDDTNAQHRLYITSSGNVGIGTTSPTYPLDVVGDIRSSANTRVGTNLIVGGYTDITGFVNHRTDIRVLNKAATNWLSWATRDTTGTEAVIDLNYIGDIAASGNVGIGTTSPAQKLEVSFAGSVYGARFTRNDAAGSSLIEFANNAGVKSIIGYDAGTDAYRIGTPSSNYNLIVKQSGNVGIGTTSPGEKLHVAGNIAAHGSVYPGYNTDTGTRIDGSVAGQLRLWASNYVVGIVGGAERFASSASKLYTASGIHLESNGSLYVNGSGNSYFANGNVGIGTTSPNTKLSVSGNSGERIQIISTDTSLAADELVGAFEVYKTDGSINGAGVFGSLNVYSQDLGGSSYVTLNTSYSDGNNIERVRINAQGNVGIGETSIDARLHITTASSGLVNQKFESAGSAAWRIGIPASQTYFAFDNSADALTSPKMVINSSGNVGIGTTSPSEKLHVAGNGLFTGGVYVNNTSAYLWNTTNGVIRFGTNNLERARIDASGNVGINNTNPVYRLHAKTDSNTWGYRFENNTADEDVHVFLAHGGGYGLAVDSTDNSSSTYLLSLKGGAGGTGLGTVEHFRVTSAGNVGIGTVSPIVGLDVRGTAIITNQAGNNYNENLRLPQATSGYAALTLGGSIAASGTSAAQWTILKFPTNDNFAIRNNNSDLLYITTGGNVGIGTSSPVEKLMISNAGAEAIHFNPAYLGQSYIYSYNRSTGGYVDLILQSLNLIFQSNGGNERMRITSGGNVGIGTTSPNAQLQIDTPASNSAGQGLRLNRPSAGTHYHSVEFATDGTVDWSVGQNLNDAFEVYENGAAATTRLTIKEGGNVGIGTTSPSGKLMVQDDTAGSATKIIVSNGGTVQSGTAARVSFYEGTSEKSYIERRRDGTGITAFVTPADDNPFSFINATGEFMRMVNGNVGIGTTSPTTRLDLGAGNGAANGLSFGSSSTGVHRSSDGTTLDMGHWANVAVIIDTDNNDSSRHFSVMANSNDSTTATTLMRVLETGNVGIGNTSPNQKLELSVGSGVTGGLRINYAASATTEGMDITYLNTGSTTTSFDSRYNSDSAVMQFRMKTAVTPVTAMTIIGAGNVGIGTTSPTYKLDVNGGTSRITYAGYSGFEYHNTAGTWEVYIGTENNSGHARYNSRQGDHTWYANGSATMKLTSAGNVGIGTTSPSYKLHLDNNATGYIARFQGDTNNISFYDGGTGGIGIGSNVSQDLKLYVNDSLNTGIVIKSSGNVGIGTTSPDSKFHVEDTNPEVRITGTGGTSFPRLLWEYPVSATQASRWALTAGASANIFYLYNYTQSKKILQVDGAASHITLNHDAAGTTQIGTSTTQTAYQLYVATNVGQTGAIEAAGSVKITSGALGVNIAASATAGRIDASNDIVAYSTSDKRLKENIKPLENATEKVKKLTGVEFDWKQEHKAVHGYEGHDVGVIAQEVQEVLPEAIRTNDSGYLSVRYEKLIGLLIESNKELAARIEELEQKLKQ